MKYALLLFALVTLSIGYAQSLQLSSDSKVSVLTFGPGESLNDAFGHNAFRIKDRARGIDLVYGYGEYDFDAPFFYLKFAQGKLNYLISRHRYDLIINHYKNENRTIKEQILDLDLSQKQKLFSYLETNYKPENRRYVYDFFYDNCATRIRDVAEIATDNTIIYNYGSRADLKSFRSLIYEHIDKNTWGSLGIDMALGSIIDRETTPREYMFLPKYIHHFFETAQIEQKGPLVKASNTVFSKQESISLSKFITSPLVVLSLLALGLLYKTFSDYKRQRRSRTIDVVLAVFTGVIGIVLFLLWFATDHSATAYNYNLLWAFPLNFILIRQLAKSKPSRWVKGYIKFLILMLCLLTLHWIVGVQVFAIGLIPLLAVLVIRYMYVLYYISNH